MQNVYGSGVLWGTPLADASGASIATPTPVQFGVLQEVSLDFTFENKSLHGQNQFPIAMGRGKGKIGFKARAAQINAALFNSIFFGQTLTSGITSDVYDTTGTVIPATPYQITAVPPSAGTFAVNLGVNASGGIPMTRVTGTPAAGQYSVTAGGVYTFASADVGSTVFINYQYAASSTTAKQQTGNNLLMGYAPSFRADIYLPFQGKSAIWTFYKCIGSKLAMATKLDDFVIPEFDFEAFADDNQRVYTYAFTE